MSDVTAKADRCHRLLNDPDLTQAFQDVRDAIHQQFERAGYDPDILVGLKHNLNLLDSIVANLELAIENGKLEAYSEEQKKVSFLGDLRWNKV